MMRVNRVLIAATAAALLSSARAETINLSALKCSQFNETAKESSSVITAWLAGYYTEVSETEVIDLVRLREVGQKLTAFCGANPNFTVSAAAEGLLSK